MTLRQGGMRGGLDTPPRPFPAGWIPIPEGPPPPGYTCSTSPYVGSPTTTDVYGRSFAPSFPWVPRKTPEIDFRYLRAWHDVVWFPEAELYVAVGANQNLDGETCWQCMTSPDGGKWTIRETPMTADAFGNRTSWAILEVGGGHLVALGAGGTHQIMRCGPDLEWELADNPIASTMFDIQRGFTGCAYGQDMWIAVADLGLQEDAPVHLFPRFIYSLDSGASWEPFGGAQTPFRQHRWTDIAYGETPEGGGLWVVVSRRDILPGDESPGGEVIVPPQHRFSESWAVVATDPLDRWYLKEGPGGGADVVEWIDPAFNRPQNDLYGPAFCTLRKGRSETTWGYRYAGRGVFSGPGGVVHGLLNQPYQQFALNAGWLASATPGENVPANWGPASITYTNCGWGVMAVDPDTGFAIALANKDATIENQFIITSDPTDPGPALEASAGYKIWRVGWSFESDFQSQAIACGKPGGVTQWVILGYGFAMTSDDNGARWTSHWFAGTARWNCIAFGGPCEDVEDGDERVFVMLGLLNAPDAAAWSTSAVDWERVETPGSLVTEIAWRDVIWAPHPANTFVGVGSSVPALGSVSAIMTSADGKEWGGYRIIASGLSRGEMSSIAYSPQLNRYVVVGDQGAYHVRTTTDLESTWDVPSDISDVSLTSCRWKAIDWDGEVFLAVGYQALAMVSEDGDTWVDKPMPPEAWNDVVAGRLDGRPFFLAVAQGELGPESLYRAAITFDRGDTWEPIGTGNSTALQAVAWSPDLAVALGNTGSSLHRILTSFRAEEPFASTATARPGQPFPIPRNYTGLCWGRDRFAGVSSDDERGAVITCQPARVDPGLRQSEDLKVREVLLFDLDGTGPGVVVGAPEDQDLLEGAVTVLNDDDNATYVGNGDTGRNMTLQVAFERPLERIQAIEPEIEGFDLYVTCFRSRAQDRIIFALGDGLPDLQLVTYDAGTVYGVPSTKVFNHTRRGLGTWTVDEFGDLTAYVSLNAIWDIFDTDVEVRIQKVFARIYYARPESPPTMPPSETVEPNVVLAFDAEVIGAAPTLAGATLALGDWSDITYLQKIAPDLDAEVTVAATVGFAPLRQAYGRHIVSFQIVVFQYGASNDGTIHVSFGGGLPIAPAGATVPCRAELAYITLGPFTKVGGGPIAEDQFNTLVCTVAATSAVGMKVYRVDVRPVFLAP